jgi:hypothetical protein
MRRSSFARGGSVLSIESPITKEEKLGSWRIKLEKRCQSVSSLMLSS